MTLSKNKKTIIEQLEKKIVRYKDLLTVTIRDNKEPFVSLNPDVIPNGYNPIMSDTSAITGPRVLVRQDVYKRLVKAQQLLKTQYPSYTLYVTYGYRSLEVQTNKFLEQLNKIKRFFPNPSDLYEETHRFIAVPTVAGHPTGGAIDIIIKDKKTNKSLDFGSVQYEYATKNCYVFINTISKKQKENRMLLRNILTRSGFAPFDGEWWHFSYGDREWAYYYKKSSALYNQISDKKLIIGE